MNYVSILINRPFSRPTHNLVSLKTQIATLKSRGGHKFTVCRGTSSDRNQNSDNLNEKSTKRKANKNSLGKGKATSRSRKASKTENVVDEDVTEMSLSQNEQLLNDESSQKQQHNQQKGKNSQSARTKKSRVSNDNADGEVTEMQLVQNENQNSSNQNEIMPQNGFQVVSKDHDDPGQEGNDDQKLELDKMTSEEVERINNIPGIQQYKGKNVNSLLKEKFNEMFGTLYQLYDVQQLDEFFISQQLYDNVINITSDQCEQLLKMFNIWKKIHTHVDDSIYKKIRRLRSHNSRNIYDVLLLVCCKNAVLLNQGAFGVHQHKEHLGLIEDSVKKTRKGGVYSLSLMLFLECLLSSTSLSAGSVKKRLHALQKQVHDSQFKEVVLPLRPYQDEFYEFLFEVQEEMKEDNSLAHFHMVSYVKQLYMMAKFVEQVWGPDDLRAISKDNMNKLVKLMQDYPQDQMGPVDLNSLDQQIQAFVANAKSNNYNPNEQSSSLGIFLSVGENGEAQVSLTEFFLDQQNSFQQSNNGEVTTKEIEDDQMQEVHKEAEKKFAKLAEVFEQLGFRTSQGGSEERGENDDSDDIEDKFANMMGKGREGPPMYDDSAVGILGINPKSEDHQDKVEQIRNTMAIMHHAAHQQYLNSKKAAKAQRKQAGKAKKAKRLGHIDDMKKKASISADVFYESDPFDLDQLQIQASVEKGRYIALQGLCNTIAIYSMWMMCASASIGRGDGRCSFNKTETETKIKIRCSTDNSSPEGEFYVGKFFQDQNKQCVKVKKRWLKMKQYIQEVCGMGSGTEWQSATELFDPSENRWILSEHWMEWCLWKRLI